MKLLTPTPTPPPPIVIEFTREEAFALLRSLVPDSLVAALSGVSDDRYAAEMKLHDILTEALR